MRPSFPLPDVDEPLTGPFWQHAADGVLAMPQRADGSWAWYPKEPDLTWVPVSGRGTVFSWSEVHQVFLPAYASDVPFLTGLVALEEAPLLRVATRFVDCDVIEIGQPVEVVFRDLSFPTVEGSVRAPFFRSV
jgi:uncharacterized protein